MIYLTYEELIHVGIRVIGDDIAVRDAGLLESALARPRTTAFGKETYASIEEKAVVLAHSLARNHGLVDGNKRLALAAMIVFLGINGRQLTWTNDQAYDFIMDLVTDDEDMAKFIHSVATGGL